MAEDFASVFAALKPLMSHHRKQFTVTLDTPMGYTLVTKKPSSFPQHKGEPMYFGGVRMGKAYVSFYLMPLYMCPAMEKSISPALLKRKQGKTCFNFKAPPDPELLAELKRLTEAGIQQWKEKQWL